jgi:hypothetical protein
MHIGPVILHEPATDIQLRSILKKDDDIKLKKELETMLERMRKENSALHRLIEALKDQKIILKKR